MANLFDYIAWRGDLPFDRFPFNPVDNLVFSQLSYLPMDGLVPGPGEKGCVSVSALAALHAAMRGAGGQADALRDPVAAAAALVLGAIGDAPRYRDCAVFDYANSTDAGEEKQFAAFCAEIGRKRSAKRLLAVYRGTDASLVGWKEDFNMSFINSVPAQRQAVAFLDAAAKRLPWPIIVAGHSKGGNLAIYAAAFCSEATQRRIAAVYSNDAPGFRRETIQSKGYQAVRSRIRAFVPQSSFVGMLLEHGEAPEVVKSSASGFAQHGMCSWEAERDGLADGGELTAQSRMASNIIREWIGKMGEERRHQFADALYKILVSTNASSFIELSSDWPGAAAGIIGGLKNIDAPTKRLMGEILGELFKTARKNIIGQRKKPAEESEPLWDVDLLSEE